ncbi:MAG TPA: sigma-70 family RNA polymerase sigma factor [Phenylobacterium sp.]|uniref:sigma-70 family RNA polymerase sigma factor n=1 Tax=Phenylobacterium sp. TaxID=1871053 RepID=UPI002BC04E26|nr:sigma-70 family RNA polymerase sigma factor [Phenylobacterium sp.]HSV04015.1 sigma-70 family RNA polymerase sigma factor [Phenylobacterium sp.]
MSDKPSADRFEAELLAAAPFMRAFGRALTGDVEQAEDLAQETLLQAWRCRDQFRPGTNLRAWLSTILRNRFYSSQRRRKWRAEYDSEIIERTLVAPDDPSANVELEDVRRALAMLPDFQREALILVGAGGLAYEEVAQIMGCPVGTVKSRVRRARDELQALLFGARLAHRERSPSALGALLSDFDSIRRGSAVAA